jgi:hypothetical protein
MTPQPIDINKIDSGINLIAAEAIIFWHPKEPGQVRERVADVFHIPNTIYMADGKLIPKIVYELDEHHLKGHLYTLISLYLSGE